MEDLYAYQLDEAEEIVEADVVHVSSAEKGDRFIFIKAFLDKIQASYDRLKGNLVPSDNETHSLGSSTLRWLDLIVKNVYSTGQVQAVNFSNYSILVYDPNEDIIYDSRHPQTREITLTRNTRLDWGEKRYVRSQLIVKQDDTGGHQLAIEEGTHVSGSLDSSPGAVNLLDITCTGVDVYILITGGYSRV